MIANSAKTPWMAGATKSAIVRSVENILKNEFGRGRYKGERKARG